MVTVAFCSGEEIYSVTEKAPRKKIPQKRNRTPFSEDMHLQSPSQTGNDSVSSMV